MIYFFGIDNVDNVDKWDRLRTCTT